jgi:crotonobetainyl-CoA:carnitine CoA-transferase CaiB-like acyl-CoA transferase
MTRRLAVLSPYRVLDLTDTRAELGPMMLADLGADVIKIEPPGGSPSRRAAPIASGLPPETPSLRFHAFNRNKRSVTLDLDTDGGRAAFRRLAATADFLFENDRPGAMAARGLGYDELRAVNPRLVYVAITPFGQDGPYAGHLATDLTLAAMGGMIAINGDSDRPPVRISVPQAWYHAAAESAVAAMVAHHRRLQSDQGQFVDVSVQAAVFWTMLNASIAHAIQGRDIDRDGMSIQLGTIVWRVMFRCKDGSVVLPATGAGLAKLMDWVVADGVVPQEWLTEEDWPTFDRRLLMGQPLTHTLDEVLERLEAFSMGHTKRELLEWGVANGVFLAPSNTVPELLDFNHLKARHFWQPYTLPDGRTVRMLGPWIRLSRTPITYRRGTPAPGQHTDEVLGVMRNA